MFMMRVSRFPPAVACNSSPCAVRGVFMFTFKGGVVIAFPRLLPIGVGLGPKTAPIRSKNKYRKAVLTLFPRWNRPRPRPMKYA